jgi:hypothetical protein
MAQTRSGRRSYGPYGCLLFLLGIGFLIAGLGSGMVQEAISKILAQSPEANGSNSALGIWALVTFGSLGLGSIGIRYYGLRSSTLGFGIILVLCGLLGLFVQYSGGETSNSGNVIWVAVNFVGDMVGSLLIASIAALVGGVILVLGVLLTGSHSIQETVPQYGGFAGDITSKFTQSLKKGQILTCPRCGHSNANWFVVCEQCGKRLSVSRQHS